MAEKKLYKIVNCPDAKFWTKPLESLNEQKEIDECISVKVLNYNNNKIHFYPKKFLEEIV